MDVLNGTGNHRLRQGSGVILKRLLPFLISVAGFFATACKMDVTFPLCGEPFGPCDGSSSPASSTPTSRNAETMVIRGFPNDQIHYSESNPSEFRGWIHVGQAVSLNLMSIKGEARYSVDTLRVAATWRVDDSTAARITSGPGGEGMLIGLQPGRVAPIYANGASWSVYACDRQLGSLAYSPVDCTHIVEISVIP